MLLQAESEVEVKGENANKNQDKDKHKHEAADVVDDKHEYDDRDDDDHLKTGVDFAYRNCVDSKQSNYEDGVEVSASYYDEVKDKDKLDDDDEDSNDDWNSLTLEGLLEEATKAILLKHNCDVEATESKLKQIITTLRTDVTNVQQTNSMLTTEKEQALAEVQRGNATITTLRTKMANLQHKNTSLVTEKEQAIVEIDKGKAAIITVRTEVAILQQTISTLTTEKEQASAEADLLATETKATLQRANDETTRKRETIRMKEKILSELKAEQVDQQAQLEDVRADLEASNTENQLLLPLTNQLQTRIDMLVEKVRIIADLKAENVDQQTQLDDVHTQLEAAKTENKLLLPLTHQLQKRIDMMMEEFQMISELKVEKVVHQKQLKDVRTQLEAATSELQRIVPLTNQLQTRINMLVEEGQIVSELKAEKGIHLEQLEEVTTQLVATATENKRLLPLTNQLQTRIDMLTEVGVDQQTQLGDIRTQLEAATTENGRLLPLTNQLQTRITVLMDEFQIISELKAEKVVHQKQLQDVRTQLETATVENQRIVPLTNQLQMRINVEMEEGQLVADLKVEKVLHQQQLETVRTQLEATATENQHLLCLTDQLKTKINMLMEDIPIISELEAEKVVHQQQLEDVRMELEATTTENQRLLGLTEQLQTRINTLMEDIPELEAEKVVHQQQLEEVRTQLEAATTENQRIVPLTNQLQTRINMLVKKGQIVAELEVEKVIQQTQLENVHTQLEATTTENQRLVPLTQELQTRIETLTEVGVEQQTQLGEVRTQLETATTEKDRLLPLTTQLQARIDLLMGEFPIISELKAEKVVQQQQLEEITAQLVAALAENERIVPLTDQLQTRIEMLTEVVRNNLMEKQKD